jgi:hypothetical protein
MWESLRQMCSWLCRHQCIHMFGYYVVIKIKQKTLKVRKQLTKVYIYHDIRHA